MNKQDRKALEEGIEGWQEYCNSLPGNIAAGKKQQLLAMAKRGEPRPQQKHPLGDVFVNYVRKDSKSYDFEFREAIIKFAPQWFGSFHHKQQLLEMAKLGEERPNKQFVLGRVLCHYTIRYSGTYDPSFDKQIRKLAPHWFINKITTVEKKQQLIEMAKRGEKRPSCRKHPLGKVLFHYTNQSACYDSVFDKQIRKLAPHWFK